MKNILNSIIRYSLLLSAFGVLTLTLWACNDNEDDFKGGSKLPISRVSIIPMPTSLTHGMNNISIPQEVTFSNELKGINAELLTQTLSSISSSVSPTDNANAFIKVHSDPTLKEEGYKIAVNDEGCHIYYNTPVGLLWGVQTMRQILVQHSSANGYKSIPRLTLSDTPKKEWRGFHIDVARHMFSMEFLKKIVDQLSFYKINKFQIHLTDDQGWRIEIKKYPELTTIGGWRKFDKYDKEMLEKSETDKSYVIDPRYVRNTDEYGGFYTQAQIADLVAYATARGIEVIPEIDMPGHFSAGIKAYPHLSCTGEAGWGEEFSYPVCAGKTQNYQFFKDIIDEVSALFPSTHFHIGGDEVEKDNWTKCPDCQKLIREENLINVDGLQNYFIKHMADYVRTQKGKEVMAWDDAFIEREPQELLYTYWRDWKADQPAKITQQGYPLIFMEWGRFYLSATPSDDLLKSLYEFEFEPQFKGIVKSNVIGYQACVWTEWIPNEGKFGEHVFPSLQAFAELSWGSSRDWSSFSSRIPWHLEWLKKNGISPRTPDFVK